MKKNIKSGTIVTEKGVLTHRDAHPKSQAIGIIQHPVDLYWDRWAIAIGERKEDGTEGIRIYLK